MDYSRLPNPFDFANPVLDPQLFAGRTSEMNEIRYYLDLATKAPRAINLAIMGERASGKTSLLNMIEHEAKQRGFCTVRVDLDESDVVYELIFFQKLFDSLLTSACISGAYGGIHARTYDTYRSMVDAYQVPEADTFRTFVLPLQYARAMAAGHASAVVSSSAFKQDIQGIQSELGRPVAILMDECDVLGTCKVLLEKLRNIFMNIQGFMLVLTGTQALFPLMSDVFSPIVRQFKTINMKPFEDPQDTEQCIHKRLESIGVVPEDLVSVSTIDEIARGRPYEIQLICHILFKRVQQGRAKVMEPTVDALDEVLEALQAFQGREQHHTINAIRGLDRDGLAAVAVLCASAGFASFEQVWFAEYALHGTSHWSRNALKSRLDSLEQAHVISLHGDKIEFEGDDLDRLYFKYYSRKHRVDGLIADLPPEFWFGLRMGRELTRQQNCLRALRSIEAGVMDAGIPEVFTILARQDREHAANPFDTYPTISRTLYELNFGFHGRAEYQIMSVSVVSPWYRCRRWFTFNPMDCHLEQCQEHIEGLLGGYQKRIEEYGGQLFYEICVLPVLEDTVLVGAVLSADNQDALRNAFDYHYAEMINAYLESGDDASAERHAQFALNYALVCAEADELNNIGYVLMALGDPQHAGTMFTEAVARSVEPTTTVLAQYNLSVKFLQERDIALCQEALEKARAQVRLVPESRRRMRCLLVPRSDPKGICIQQVIGPDLLDAVEHAITTVASLSGDTDFCVLNEARSLDETSEPAHALEHSTPPTLSTL